MSNDKNFNVYSVLGLIISINALFFLGVLACLLGGFNKVILYLIFVLLLISPIVGLIFSIKGFLDSKKSENNKSVASVAGISISLVGVLLVAYLAVSWYRRIYPSTQPTNYTVEAHEYNYESFQKEWEREDLKWKGYPDNYPETPLEDNFHLKLEYDYAITRDENDAFKDITWRVIRNDRRVLERNANGELLLESDLQWIKGDDGKFTIYLIAYIDGQYRRVSNIIEYSH